MRGIRVRRLAGAYLDEESGKVIGDHIAGLEELLLGRTTYEVFAAYWPKQPASNPIAARLNGAPKYVASRTLEAASGPARQRQAAVRGGHGADRAAAGGVGDLPQGRRTPRLRARR